MRRTVLAVGLALATALVGTVGAAAAPTAADRRRVVVGSDGYLFIAQDWTVACQDAGSAAAVGRRMSALATALSDGGRPTTVVIGPDKSTVRSGNVVASRVPARSCAQAQKAALWAAADQSQAFLDLRRPLSAAGSRQQTYWRKDTHWTPTGAGVYAQQLAKRLDPLLPSLLTGRPTTFSRSGDLARVLQQPAGETVRGLQLVNPGVTVRELPERRTGLRIAVRETRADPGLTGRVVPGRTVFVGDSFDDTAVEQLAPLFADAVFLWLLPDDTVGPVLDELRGADRVVVETVERFASRPRSLRGDVLDGVRALPRHDAPLVPLP